MTCNEKKYVEGKWVDDSIRLRVAVRSVPQPCSNILGFDYRSDTVESVSYTHLDVYKRQS